MSSADELKKLKDLLDSGVLTQEEFDTQKSKILSSESSDEPKVIIDDNKSKKNNSTFKWVIGVIVVVAVFALFSSDDSSSSTTTSSNSTSENSNVDTISSTNTTDACSVYEKADLNNMVVVLAVTERFSKNSDLFVNDQISGGEFFAYVENDYQILKNTYYVQLDLKPTSENEEYHEYRLKEIESLMFMYELMIKSNEELNMDYFELAFTYLDQANYYLELASDAYNSC